MWLDVEPSLWLRWVRPVEFAELPAAAAPVVAEFRDESFMLRSELEVRLPLELYVPLELESVRPAALVSLESELLMPESEVPARDPVVDEDEEVEEDGVGDVVFAFGLPTCELVDCAPAEPATRAPASRIAEQA